MSRSMKIALGILAAFVLYFAVRMMTQSDGDANDRIPVASPSAVPTLDKPVPEKRSSSKDNIKVLVRQSYAKQHPIFLTFKGRSEPARVVSVKAETTGVVVSVGAEEGQLVNKGDVLCQIEVASRQARVNEARASLETARIDYEATAQLVEQGWKPPNQKLSAKAKLDTAKAALETAEIELSKTRIRAPFSGVFEVRQAEVGDFLTPGAACGQVLDLDPLVVSADMSEKYAGLLQAGAEAIARLGKNSQIILGRVRYVASSSDEATGTYRLEVALENKDGVLPAGQSADVRIQIGEGLAHHISPALIVYSDEGAPGVRYVGPDELVQLALVEIVDSDDAGVWVGGLPDEARIIVQGQDYVQEGLKVEAVAEEEST